MDRNVKECGGYCQKVTKGISFGCVFYITYPMTFPISMKLRLFFLFFCSFLVIFQLYGTNQRIVGYLPVYRFGLVEQIELDKLTHLVLAFGQPNAQGRLEVSKGNIWPIIKRAHQHNVKVLLSLGGGLEEDEARYWSYYQRPENRDFFIRNIVQFVLAYELDGIDVDLEWSNVQKHYSGFVLDLKRALAPHNKIFTAALPAIHRYEHLSDEALASFDFVNLMVYDLTGPWKPETPGQHSPFSFAVSSIDFWRKEGLSSDRMTLGLPVFGWDFSLGDTVSSITYRELVAIDSSFALLDQVGHIYYNGLPLIKAKTELALEEVSGVMLWEIGQDAFNEFSVLKAVHEIVNPSMPGEPMASPNPSIQEGTTLLGGSRLTKDHWLIEENNGRLHLVRRRDGNKHAVFSIPRYPPAFYFSAYWGYQILSERNN